MDPLRRHLQTLGLTEHATLGDAQAAYKDLIRVWHPDRFESDPKLRAKAEAQTREINLAMTELRTALKQNRPRLQPSAAVQHRNQHAPSHREATTPSASQREPHATTAPPTLAIHQAKRVSLFQVISGLAMFYLGLLLIFNFANKGPAQTALGVVLVGHGFSTSLFALAILCLKRPVITVNQSFIGLLGMPAISLFHVEDAHMIVSRQGSFLTISCTKDHITALPLHMRWALKLRHLLRRNHFEFKATSLDTHPARVIDMLDTMASLRQVRPAPLPRSRPWGRYANVTATVCIAVALVRCLMQHDTSLTSLMPYLILFVLFRSAALVQTVVLAPSR